MDIMTIGEYLKMENTMGIIFIIVMIIVACKVIYDNTGNRKKIKEKEIEELEEQREELSKKLEIERKELEKKLEKEKQTFDTKKKELEKEYSNMQEKEKAKLNKALEKNIQASANLNAEIETLKSEKISLTRELENLNKDLIIEYSNFDEYLNISSQEIKNKLNMLKVEQNNLVKDNLAVFTTTTQDNSNKKSLNNNIAQILRNFNTECNLVFDNLTIRNIDTSRSKIEKSYITLNKIYEVDYVQISQKYYELKLEEFILHYNYLQKVEDEKEEKKAIREQLMEEEKERRELEHKRDKIEIEEGKYKREISRLEKAIKETTDDKVKQTYIDERNDYNNKLKLLEKEKENLEYLEQNIRAGWVYIISNVGSFGDNVFKIGMTRRSEPMDRINELCNASVPFRFEVHALIFSEDAVALESALHQTFKEYRVNKHNTRKEFFNVDLEKIKEVVKNNYSKTVDFKD